MSDDMPETDPDGDEDAEVRAHYPYAVVGPIPTEAGGKVPLIARFAQLADAERFCGTLPGAEYGHYGIDGPESEVTHSPPQDRPLLDVIRDAIRPVLTKDMDDPNTVLALVLEDFGEACETAFGEDSNVSLAEIIDNFLRPEPEPEPAQTSDIQVILTRALDALPHTDLIPGTVSWEDVAGGLKGALEGAGWAYVGLDAPDSDSAHLRAVLGEAFKKSSAVRSWASITNTAMQVLADEGLIDDPGPHHPFDAGRDVT